MKKFVKNMGQTDRTLRMIIGIALLAAGIAVQILYGMLWWLAVPGVILMISSAAARCPMYIPFGINTRKNAE
ncbi:YgaP family membrane protein [Salinispira pacifica]|uniref:Inner membrane protein YgaP-like transmembrane domain-containing protein n=1 Tax=Salinispira pacifica TaxID=1307761 RepID=V5WM04_9SPIO|nr:DUF2892 domain-containing protein [Salinispira pacifica]AHC16131.1 hypothetical protein L21SP2_2781 [Salinispira pacifica]